MFNQNKYHLHQELFGFPCILPLFLQIDRVYNVYF